MNIGKNPNEKLIQAARSNDISGMLRALLDGANVNYQSPENRWTALHWCSNNLSHEAFAILTGQEDELPMLRQHVFVEFVSEFGGQEVVETAWASSISGLNPLILDDDKYLSSARASFRPFQGDPQSLSNTELVRKLIRLEATYAFDQDVNYFEHASQNGQFALPNLEV